MARNDVHGNLTQEAPTYFEAEDGTLIPGSVDVSLYNEVARRAYRTDAGEILTAPRTPLSQVNGTWGVPSGAYVSTTTGTGGSVTGAGGEIVVATGTSVGGFATMISARVMKPRDGQAVEALYTCRFSAGVANCIQLIGPQTAECGFGIGYNGETFSVFRKSGGLVEIQTLTITNGATGAENMTVTLNGVATVIASGGALSTAATAQRIAEGATWASVGDGWRVAAVGDDVVFVNFNAGNKAGSFSLTSTGGAVGTFAETTQGETGTDTWVALDSDNAAIIDKLDGTGRSGLTIDPLETNTWAIIYDAAHVEYQIEAEDGQRVTFARINSTSGPLVENPITNLQAIAYSQGSTTDRAVYVTSMGGYLLGRLNRLTARRGVSATKSSIGGTAVPVLSIRPALSFGSPARRFNAPIYISALGGGSTSGKTAIFTVYLNATLTGAAWVDESAAGAINRDTSATALSGGVPLCSWVGGVDSPQRLDVRELDLELYVGQTLTIAAEAVSGSTTEVAVTMQVQEDR